MSETCHYKVCNNTAEVETTEEAPFSMTGTASESRNRIKICKPCAQTKEILDRAPGQLDIGPMLG